MMDRLRASIDNRTGNRTVEGFHENTTLETCRELLNSLDGRTRTLLSLDRHDGHALMIGGGPEGFVVVLTRPTGESFTLSNPDGSDDLQIELCAGGQYAGFPETIVVSVDTAEEAVENFFNTSEAAMRFVPDA